MPQVIHAQLAFKSIFGQFIRGYHNARVVDKQIKLLMLLLVLFGKSMNRAEFAQIEVHQFQIGFRHLPDDFFAGFIAFFLVATSHHHLHSCFTQGQCGLKTQPIVGAGYYGNSPFLRWYFVYVKAHFYLVFGIRFCKFKDSSLRSE